MERIIGILQLIGLLTVLIGGTIFAFSIHPVLGIIVLVLILA